MVLKLRPPSCVPHPSSFTDSLVTTPELLPQGDPSLMASRPLQDVAHEERVKPIQPSPLSHLTRKEEPKSLSVAWTAHLPASSSFLLLPWALPRPHQPSHGPQNPPGLCSFQNDCCLGHAAPSTSPGRCLPRLLIQCQCHLLRAACHDHLVHCSRSCCISTFYLLGATWR